MSPACSNKTWLRKIQMILCKTSIVTKLPTWQFAPFYLCEIVLKFSYKHLQAGKYTYIFLLLKAINIMVGMIYLLELTRFWEWNIRLKYIYFLRGRWKGGAETCLMPAEGRLRMRPPSPFDLPPSPMIVQKVPTHACFIWVKLTNKQLDKVMEG